MKKIAILGSTGSIGESTLKVVRHLNGPGSKAILKASKFEIFINKPYLII